MSENPDRKPRTIEAIHPGRRADMAGLPTVRPLPTGELSQEEMDPFIFLNHHGPTEYPPDNQGLPFEPHPHRGMQTVTFIVDGDVLHRDNVGDEESVIGPGGVQWMVAGSGLLHLETSSEEFKQQGGDLEILQLWVNLPRKHKSVEPTYVGLQSDDIPIVELDDGRVEAKIVAGSLGERDGGVEPLTDVEMYWLDFDESGEFSTEIEPSRNVFFYVVRGEVEVNGETVDEMSLVEFGDEGENVDVVAEESSLVLFGHATPYDEPIVARGPFVMNSEEEIQQAYQALRNGEFGTWPA